MEKLPLLLYGCILGMVIMALVFYLELAGSKRPNALRQEDEKSTQKNGFVIVILLLSSLLIVVVNKLRSGNECEDYRSSSSSKRSENDISD